MNASIRAATVGQGSRTRRLKQSDIETTTQNLRAEKPSIEGIHNEMPWHSLPTPPTTPPAAKSPSPSPTSPPIEEPIEEPETYDRYLHGASIQSAELLCAKPPVSSGPDDSIQSFTFTFRVPRDYTQIAPPSPCNSYTLHAELLRRSSPTPELTAAPIFVYLCGGPGSGQQPDRHRLLNRYVVANGYQMLLLDYRGCGRSQPLTVDSVLARTSRSRRCGSGGSGSTSSNHEAVRAFQEVRQGNIVRDFEAVRRFLVDYIPGQRDLEDRFVLLGQSYGGWIALTYADRYPGSVRAVLLTGGMPPLGASPERVYARLFDEVTRANELFYARYPDAVQVVRRIATGILRAQDGRGVKRRRVSKRRKVEERYGADDNVPSLATFASMGRLLGEPDGARKLYERLALMDKHMAETGGPPRFEDMDTHRFNDRLPYAFDHEIQCYVSTEGQTSNWAARTVRDSNPAYDWISSSTEDELAAAATATASSASSSGRMHFLGEAFMPEHADDYASLRALGGRAFADEVVRAGQTETLFDMDRLRDNAVPVYAVIYRKDMYVDADLAVEAAAKVGCVKCVRLPEASELRHNAIRESADQVIGIFRDLGFDGFPRDPEI
ncbi:hypothetical protein PpBr36_02524 [Pyricularia pennisetigena]|uniref:hypothetical protein n=1 Tax=Pyricularia pennisetigena TaxID=1578925 RepID=UPI00114E6A7E|nr:hypothetical protein PpBr36_02524 [Pyricularia pennisetigena]TLS30592.1 hypothetical protein PpBr36_02524 [Pyricularia pennisetigena]